MAIRVTILIPAVPLLMLAVPPDSGASMSAEEQLVDPVKNGALQKLGPWLGNLSDEFQQAPDKQAFQTRNPVPSSAPPLRRLMSQRWRH